MTSTGSASPPSTAGTAARTARYLARLLPGFRGRIGRQDFWIGCGLLAIVSWLVAQAMFTWEYGVWTPPYSYMDRRLGDALLVFAIVSAPLGAKRFHDIDYSGWAHLLRLLPVIGQIWWFSALGLFPGTRGANRFGPDPLAPADAPPAPSMNDATHRP